ncbi:MAG: dihydroneopterin aldolase [Gammaproteobacteria bacterium]|nr:dihydroneopterin aldolase [Gammaproteobacteria bacterium]
MVGPISNDKILPSGPDGRANKTNSQNDGDSTQSHQASNPVEEAAATSDTLNLSNAGKLVSREVDRSPSESIETLEQAESLVERLREQFQNTGAQALSAHGGLQPQEVAGLV